MTSSWILIVFWNWAENNKKFEIFSYWNSNDYPRFRTFFVLLTAPQWPLKLGPKWALTRPPVSKQCRIWSFFEPSTGPPTTLLSRLIDFQRWINVRQHHSRSRIVGGYLRRQISKTDSSPHQLLRLLHTDLVPTWDTWRMACNRGSVRCCRTRLEWYRASRSLRGLFTGAWLKLYKIRLQCTPIRRRFKTQSITIHELIIPLFDSIILKGFSYSNEEAKLNFLKWSLSNSDV